MAKIQLPISYGNEFAKSFFLEKAPSFLLKPMSRSQLAVTRLTLKQGLSEPAVGVTPEKAFTISVHLFQPVCQGWGTWVNRKFLPVKSWVEGGVGIYDLESDPIAVRPSAFDSVHYNLPRTTLDAFTEDCGLPRVGELFCAQGTPDTVLHHLTQMILPSLEQPNLFCELFLDHFVLMFCAHVVNKYSGAKAEAKVYQGGLAPWQRRCVTALLDEHLDGNLKLSTLADECGLSVSHFARSFKRSFGTSAHRYLILQRLEKAKDILLHSNEPLTEIALETGFSDQAAFCRTFRAIVGTTPGKWRNENTHGRHFSSSFLHSSNLRSENTTVRYQAA
jgi:AraC family transcriptional regulator